MWKRVPEKDKRFANGDDYAGDAWEKDGVIKYTVVGYDLNEDKPSKIKQE